MLGLATRQDVRAVPAILEELSRPEFSNLAIDAASEMPNASFLKPLEALLEQDPTAEGLQSAIDRCRKRLVHERCVTMIHYNVWFSFKEGTVESDELAKVVEFLDDLKAKHLLHDYTLLRHRAGSGTTRLARFHAAIRLREDQFPLPFQHVGELGVHAGNHGRMIENVETFVVEIFDELVNDA